MEVSRNNVKLIDLLEQAEGGLLPEHCPFLMTPYSLQEKILSISRNWRPFSPTRSSVIWTMTSLTV